MKKTKMINLRISPDDEKRMQEIQEKLKMNRTEVILVAIMRLHSHVVR